MGRLAPTAIALVVTAGIAGCGGGHHSTQIPPLVTTGSGAGGATVKTTPPPPQLEIDASVPSTGPDASFGRAELNGMKLALANAGERAGTYTIDFDWKDIGSRTSGWSAKTLAAFAAKSATSQDAIAYIGDLASSASQVSIPILNTAGIPQIVPGSPDTRLFPTQAAAGGQHAAPVQTPTNYVRLAPSNVYQAIAILDWLHTTDPSCTRLALPYGADPDGEDLAGLLARLSRSYQLTPIGYQAARPIAPGSSAKYMQTLTRDHANCAVYSGTIAGGAVAVTEALHEALAPGAKIVGSSGVCTSAWTNPAQGGVIPTRTEPDLDCAAPGPGLGLTPAGKFFQTAYKHDYKAEPEPAAAYGYEAMELILNTIAELGQEGNSRASVLNALHVEPQSNSVIGSFSFKSSGDTTNTDYSIYGVAPGGSLKFLRTVRANAASPAAGVASDSGRTAS